MTQGNGQGGEAKTTELSQIASSLSTFGPITLKHRLLVGKQLTQVENMACRGTINVFRGCRSC